MVMESEEMTECVMVPKALIDELEEYLLGAGPRDCYEEQWAIVESAKPVSAEPAGMKEAMEQAFMAGQLDCGVDPSYYSAQIWVLKHQIKQKGSYREKEK